MLLLLLLFLLCAVLLVSWLNFNREAKRFNVPGPSPLPIIGNANLFVAGSSRFLMLLHDLKVKYGDAYRVHLFSYPYVVLSHPKYIEPLVSHAELIVKGRTYNFIKPWLGEGLLTSSGQRWRSHRKFLTPAFHFNILQNFLPIFCKNAEIYCNKLRDLADGTPINLFPITALAALDNVTESIMGVSVNSQKDSESEYVHAIEEATQIMAMRGQVPLFGVDLIFNLSPFKKRQDKALNILKKHTQRVIDARREELNKANITRLEKTDSVGIKNKTAFLDLLLLGEIDGERIDYESIREEVDTFMFEGHDTTTSGIVYSLYCLSKYPDVQEKVYQEQKSIFGDDMDRNPTYVELHQMKYLDLVLKECMRLYPPVPAFERLIVKDTEVGELKLIAGSLVLINVFEMHRNPEVFEDPLEFRPERFESTCRRNPFSWLAFSAGPRNCIGQKFAMMELKVTVSAIIRKLKLLPVDIEPQLCADLILRSTNGVHIVTKPRF